MSSSFPAEEMEAHYITRYIPGLERAFHMLEITPSVQSRLHRYVIDHLPTFIYMDDYRAFSGTAQLDEVHSRRNNGDLTEEDRTFLTILSLSNLDLDLLVRFGQGSMEESRVRQHDLDAGSITLTHLTADRFPQRNYAVDYRVDGQRFFTHIKDNIDSSPIELEERSKGFQWFFSFELMFLHESKGTFENCVILLDELGLHLHPNAQKNYFPVLQTMHRRILFSIRLIFLS